MNAHKIKEVHKSLSSWVVGNSLLLNAYVSFNVQSKKWVYHYDNPLTFTPEDIGLGFGLSDKELIILIQLNEIRIIKDVIKTLELECDDEDDLTEEQKTSLGLISIDYVKLIGG